MAEKVNYDYNSDPVLYCAECYSLKIMYEDIIGSDCCMDCGCTTVLTAPFEKWENLYQERYGRKFVEKTNDLKKSYVYHLTIKELKNKVSKSPKWEAIIKNVYHQFPRGLGKTEALMVFFDRLSKDNNFDTLRETLYRMKI